MSEASETLRFSIVVPMYNEEDNVERTTAAALRAVGRISDDFEIIIVNDGSADRTAAGQNEKGHGHNGKDQAHHRQVVGGTTWRWPPR